MRSKKAIQLSFMALLFARFDKFPPSEQGHCLFNQRNDQGLHEVPRYLFVTRAKSSNRAQWPECCFPGMP